MKSYAKHACSWCGKLISNNGLASASHFKACKVRLGKEPPPPDSYYARRYGAKLAPDPSRKGIGGSGHTHT